MRFLKYLIIALLLCIVFLSCEKNELVNTASAVTTNATALPKGIWEGECSKTSRDSISYYSLNILDGGSLYLLNESQQSIGAGSWVMDDSTFNAYYIEYATQHAYSITGILHTNQYMLEGQWSYNNTCEDGGSWYLIKN